MPSRTAAAAAGTLQADLTTAAPAHLPPWPDIDVGNRIPGLRTSAAFFASLKANLRLSEYSPSPLPSPRPTPLGFHGNAKTRPGDGLALPPPSPLMLNGFSTHDDDDGGGGGHDDGKTKSALPRLQPVSSLAVAGTKLLSHSRTTSRLSSTIDDADEHLDAAAAQPKLYWASSPEDTSAALSLLATTVAEQRRTALFSLLTHPLNILLFVTLLAILHKSVSCVARYMSLKKYRGPGAMNDAKLHAANASCLAVTVAASSLTLVFLAGAYALVAPYSRLARRIAAYGMLGADAKSTAAAPDDTAADPWFKPGRDEVLVAVASEPPLHTAGSTNDNTAHGAHGQPASEQSPTIVGVLIMHWAPCVAGSKFGKRRRPSGGRSSIKAWATSLHWRNQGIGAALLAEAARVTIKERGGDSASFAEMHAHAERVLPNLYNSAFERRDRRAGLALSSVVTTKPWTTNRRR